MSDIDPHHHGFLLLQPCHSRGIELRRTELERVKNVEDHTYQMVHPSEFRIHFQCHIGEILVLLFWLIEGFVELHMDCVDAQLDVAEFL